MSNMLKSARDEDQRKRDEAQFYGIQQQLDELRRQLKENLARQQWFEELYKQSESKVSQMQTAQDRLINDVAQALHARQIDDGRMKGQIAELAQRVEAPEKQIRDLRAQLTELAESRRTDRDTDTDTQRRIEELHRLLRELNSHVSQSSEAHKQVRDMMKQINTEIEEVRRETIQVAELQSKEEQRLRRQGVELQSLFETLRQQFTEVAAKSQRVDDVRHQLSERIDALEKVIQPIYEVEETLGEDIERVEKQATEQYIAQQERLETVRHHLEMQAGELRQLSDQRTDHLLGRFSQVDERIRVAEAALAELPSRFEAMERRDEMIGSEADSMEEWLVMRQITALEAMLEDVRRRRADRAGTIAPNSLLARAQPQEAPGSVYNPSGLLKKVRDARPPSKEDLIVRDED